MSAPTLAELERVLGEIVNDPTAVAPVRSAVRMLLRIEIVRLVNLERAEARQRLRSECQATKWGRGYRVVHLPTGTWAEALTVSEAIDQIEREMYGRTVFEPEPICGNLPPGGALQGLGVKCQLAPGHDAHGGQHRWTDGHGNGISWAGPDEGAWPYDA